MRAAAHPDAFRHEALLYSGQDEFLVGTSAFIRQGLEAEEPILVVVSAAKITMLRDELNGSAAAVLFADMAEIGTNPARIIPAWRAFTEEHLAPGRRVRGIGEPIWAERTPAELIECQRHESLLNLAFADGLGWDLLCPYDVDALELDVIEEARRTHPLVVEDGAPVPSDTYLGLEAIAAPFDAPLPAPPTDARELPFAVGSLRDARAFVSAFARDTGLSDDRAANLVVAVNELTTNSVRHGGGHGILRMWREDGSLVCEVADSGHIDQPLLGRECPPASQVGGRGHWIVNQLCELVQVRTYASGTVVRMHMRASR